MLYHKEEYNLHDCDTFAMNDTQYCVEEVESRGLATIGTWRLKDGQMYGIYYFICATYGYLSMCVHSVVCA